MEIIQTSIPDVLLIRPKVYTDTRGFFLETFRLDELKYAGISFSTMQENHSGSQQGVLRGLHYQIEHPQSKLIRVTSGKIYDVVVDIRRSSETFGKWMGVTLSDEEKLQLLIPAGFAHGFYVTSPWAEITYKVNDYYAPEWERCLLWNDPALGIKWPLINNHPPSLSAKDAEGKALSEADLFE